MSIKSAVNSFVRAFFFKNNSLSKTAVFLTIATAIILGLYTFTGLFAGATLLGWWVVPAFDSGAACALLTVLSGVYVASNSRLTDRISSQTDLEEKE
jgi:hypothetical protein